MTVTTNPEAHPATPPRDEMHRLELTISHLLRFGVFLAGALLCVGWLWMWWNGSDMSQNLKEYNPQTFTDTLQWAVIMQDRALLMSLVGLVVLVTLPVIRVFLTAILFVRQKDYRLAIMAFVVFMALVSSFFLGIDL